MTPQSGGKAGGARSPRTVDEDQIHHELEHEKPDNTNDCNPQQRGVLSARSERVRHDGGCQAEHEDHPESDGGEDAASGGKLIPAVETKPRLDKAHGSTLASPLF